MTRSRNRRRLEHCSISKPETGVHVTEMMVYRRLMFIFVISCKQSVNSRVVNCNLFIYSLFTSLTAAFIFAPEIFIPDDYGTKNRRQKMESINGAGFWNVCHASTSKNGYF